MNNDTKLRACNFISHQTLTLSDSRRQEGETTTAHHPAPCGEVRGKRERQCHSLRGPGHGLHRPRHHLRRDRGQGVPDPGAQAHRPQPCRLRGVLCLAEDPVLHSPCLLLWAVWYLAKYLDNKTKY